ncbi:MAG: hypothetical protein ACLSAH_17220 [Bilophila wadsworthia]
MGSCWQSPPSSVVRRSDRGRRCARFGAGPAARPPGVVEPLVRFRLRCSPYVRSGWWRTGSARSRRRIRRTDACMHCLACTASADTVR